MICGVSSPTFKMTTCVLVLLFVHTYHVVSGSTDPPFETNDMTLSQGIQHVIQQISSVLDRQDASDRQLSKLIQQQDELQQHFTQLSQRQETIQQHVAELLDSQNNNHFELITLFHQQEDKLNQTMEQMEKISQTSQVTLPETADSQGTRRHNRSVRDLTPEMLDLKDVLSNVLVKTISLQSLILRLENGRNHNEGRVEVFYNGEWGTLCGRWTDDNARVVCRQLGLPYENARAKTQSHFGEGSGRFHFRDVTCNGDENSLWSCGRDQDAHGHCRLHDDVGVACHSIRLTNGSTDNEGRIEVWYDGRWKGVCERDWDDNDAQVVCRQLHLPHEGATASAGDYYGRSTDKFMLRGFTCDGSESSLLACGHVESEKETCKHAGVVCQSQIRLIHGHNDYEGIVEVWYGGGWGLICDQSWNHTEAMVACRQLNLPPENALVKPSILFNRTNGDAKMADIDCSGSETSLAACSHRGWDIGRTLQCDENRFAAVVCQPIRLVNGTSKYDGRVEIWRNSQWGSVCDRNFDINDTHVVCRNLEMSYENAFVKRGAYFGEGNGSIWNVNCNGSESNITQCENGGFDVGSCNHSRDVGVVCGPTIRLEGGVDYHEGRVEVWHDGEWGSVCYHGFGLRESAVVCRELGLPYHNPESVFYFGSYFGEGSGPVWISSLDCRGNEDSLTTCPHEGWGVVQSRCDHSNDAGVRCELPIRLVNGSNVFEGRVEIWNHEKESWGTVCNSNLGHDDAKVICRQLGFSTDNAEIKTDAYFGKGTGPVWLHDVNCTGTETSIWACDKGIDDEMNKCDHSRDVGIVCESPIRLVGGDNKYEGRVEVWNDGSGWEFICSDTWNYIAARVVCRQLLLPHINSKSGRDFISVDSIIEQAWYNLTQCKGSEKNVLSCGIIGRGIGQCAHGFATVTCEAPIQLIDSFGSGDFYRTGRVSLWKDSEWGTVSAFGWDELDARVVCKELGFHDNVQSLRLDSKISHPSQYSADKPVQMSNVACNGTEENLWSCPHTAGDYFAEIGFSFKYDAGVLCESYSNRIRIGDGEHHGKGRVEVNFLRPPIYSDDYWTSTWGVVCKHDWDDTDAKVVCRELGLPFDNAKARKINNEYNKPSFMDNLACNGTEANLLSCPHERPQEQRDCSRIASVVCQ